MSRRIAAFPLFAVVLLGPLAWAQQEQQPQQDAMMKAMEEAARVGPHHKYLEPMVGSWDVKATMWMAPGAPPVTSTGSSENQWALGGRFLHQAFKGEFMGAPFQGYGVWGYDNVKKMHTSAWIDSMGTGIEVAYGTDDATGKVFTFNGEYPDPVSGQTKKFKEIITIQDANKHTMEMYDVGPDGKEVKTLELVYTRKTT